MNYYNEIDDYAADWIQNLIAAELIPAGHVDRRSIEDVTPADLAGYNQCHFFAGIAGWPLALRIAGFPDDFPIWTGSCPCQPFSAAGAQAGFADERHLWPAFHWLIAQRNPAIVVGEQVASKVADAWVDLVRADMEAMDYAFGAIAFPSASVGAPHIRDRTYWVAHAAGEGWRQAGRNSASNRKTNSGQTGNRTCHASPNGQLAWLDDTHGQRLAAPPILRLPNTQSHLEPHGDRCSSWPSATNGFWSAADWLACRDGYWRPVEPGTFPLAHGVSNRVGRLRAYGNAINPWQAAEFLKCAFPS